MAGLGTGLAIEQKQTMKINPAQLQKIEILQMGSIELEEKIRTELMENPVLEIAESVAEADEQRETDERSEADSRIEEMDSDPYDSYDDRDYWDMQGTQSVSTSTSTASVTDGGIAAFEKFYRTEETLGEYLIKQLGQAGCTNEVKRAAGYIIYSLNSNGLLDTELSEIAEMASCSMEIVDAALEVVQSLDPAGVGARSIEECLCLQLDPADELTPDAKAVITGYLREIAVGNVKSITRSLDISAERLVRIIELIRTLDPRPCSRFADNLPVQYMNPDVYAEIIDGEIVVYLAGSQPHLCLSSYYSSLYTNSEDPQVKEYLKERIDSALRFISNIEQRNRTILNVTRAIMERQRNFFDFGPGALRPLTMQDVADGLDISVSTVSRAISGKHIHCCGSTYPIKQFFSSEVGGQARDSVLERIKELIAQEDPAHPLSDQKIADILAGESIDISRRTVAKYRDTAGILSTSMRKKR